MVAIVLWLVAASLPLLLALGSRDFVLQVNSYREQPVVVTTEQLLCVLEGERDDGDEKNPLTLVHTTFPNHVQQLFSNKSLRTALTMTSSVDTNLDGIMDTLHVEVTTPLLSNETIRQATVVVVLNYTLKSYVQLNMDVLAIVRHSSPFAGDALYVDGELDLHQRSPFKITDSKQTPYAESPLVNISTTDTTQEILIQALISEYRERNFTANLRSPYPIWMSNLNSSNGTTQFRLLIDIRIEPISVLYTPQWPEMVKHAWIQYYCLFMVVSTLAITLREYLFANKVLASVCLVDEPRLKYAAKYQ